MKRSRLLSNRDGSPKTCRSWPIARKPYHPAGSPPPHTHSARLRPREPPPWPFPPRRFRARADARPASRAVPRPRLATRSRRRHSLSSLGPSSLEMSALASAHATVASANVGGRRPAPRRSRVWYVSSHLPTAHVWPTRTALAMRARRCRRSSATCSSPSSIFRSSRSRRPRRRRRIETRRPIRATPSRVRIVTREARLESRRRRAARRA